MDDGDVDIERRAMRKTKEASRRNARRPLPK
jgi:hypothetical protein